MRSAHPTASAIAALALVAASSSAHAHGLEGIVQPLVIAAALAGLMGGSIAGATDSHPGIGLGITIGIAIALALGYVAWAAPAEFFAGLLVALVLISFAGVIPLTIVFFVAFGVTAVLRERLTRMKSGDPAP